MSLATRLVAEGLQPDAARACSQLFGTYEEAKPYLGDPGRPPPSIKEYFSLQYQRYYYHNETDDSTSWEFPQQLQLSEWLLDASVSGLDVATCRRLLSAVLWAVESNAWKGAAVWQAVAVLARLTANIADCSNSLDKYRTVRTSNPKIREALAVLDGGEAVLLAAGFVRRPGGEGATLHFPEDPSRLQHLALVSAKLQQLVAYKGFTGLARECDDTGGSTRSRHASAPGFRYQQDIFECSCCSRPINDGSDRLITKKYDAPHGEFRYECESCSGFNLCEGCWDKFISDALSPPHPRAHAFRTHHPRASLHGLNVRETDANPWGVMPGGSAARARERLKNRTGL